MRKLLVTGLALLMAATCAVLSVPLLFATDTASGCGIDPATSGSTLPPGTGQLVGASIFGGPGDPTTPGTAGYRGDTLTGTTAFAELSTNWQQASGWDFAALGDLPRGTHLKITATINGRTRSVIATKLDIGRGGPPINGTRRAIDLWWQTANALGLPGTTGRWSGVVRVQRTDQPATGLTDDTACAPLATSVLGQKIVAVARAELAKGISEPGNNCVPYNDCNGQPWCAAFVSHVWATAGVPMPFIQASNAIWTWASQHAHVLPATATPQPGDAILYGTGPTNTTTSVHVGIVETVHPDGRITTIEGNLSNRVKRNGPFHPRHAMAAGEPGPVYAYARP